MDKPRIISKAKLYADDRGYVYCPLDNLDAYGIRRTYIIENHNKGMIRAWHLHKKGDTFIHVISGAAKIAALEYDKNCPIERGLPIGGNLEVVTLTDRDPSVFFIPRGYFNGTMSLYDNTKMLVYSTLTFNQVKNDDERMTWNVRKDIWNVEFR